jgi:uncharacterized SAM-binding protein YcdF (DUF218 family)
MALSDSLNLIWDYLSQGPSAPGQADAVVALGSHDERVAVHAADLVLHGVAPRLVITGGRGKDTPVEWDSEAAYFAEVAEKRGVAKSQVLLEPRATNTGENISYSRAVLASGDTVVQSVIFVCKPYMQRRASATAQVRWPEVRHYTSAPELSLTDYLSGGHVDPVDFINLMVGDLQRMRVYADLGYQAYQEVPEPVWAAFQELAGAGYDRYVIGDS